MNVTIFVKMGQYAVVDCAKWKILSIFTVSKRLTKQLKREQNDDIFYLRLINSSAKRPPVKITLHKVHELGYHNPCTLCRVSYKQDFKIYSILRIVYSFTPPGVATVMTSPTLRPRNAFPTGDSLEIRPAAGFAS